MTIKTLWLLRPEIHFSANSSESMVSCGALFFTARHLADWLNELSNPLGIHGLSVVNMCGKLNKGIFLVWK